MRKRQTQDMFNFSFVDILATTIGVLIFIMVLVIINSAGRVSSNDVKQITAQEMSKTGELRKKLLELLSAIRRIENILAYYKNKQDKQAQVALKLDVDIKAEKEKHKKLKLELKNLKKEAERLSIILQQKLAVEKGKEQEFKNIQKLHGIKKTKVIFRVPEERKTSKKPVFFECAGNRLYMIMGKSKFNKKVYSLSTQSQLIIISRKKSAKGFSLKDVVNRKSRISRVLRSYRSSKYYAVFLVRPDSYMFYRKVRSVFWNRHWDCIWEGQLPGSMFLINKNAKRGSNTLL